jgi:hypothetical protein
MSNPQPSDPTTACYDRNAASFAKDWIVTIIIPQ